MNKKQARVGQTIYWFEDLDSSPESGMEPPVECWGPVIALASDGRAPVVQSHYDGEPMVLSYWSRIPKKFRREILHRGFHRKRPKIVGGRRRR